MQGNHIIRCNFEFDVITSCCAVHCIALAFLLFSVTACSLCSFDGGVGSVGRRAATERTAPAIVVLGRLEGPAKWESS